MGDWQSWAAGIVVAITVISFLVAAKKNGGGGCGGGDCGNGTCG